MIDEALLDDPETLRRADAAGDLYALASAGARVRTAARLAEEAGLGALRPDGRPRTVLVAGHGVGALCGELLAAFGGTLCPILTLRPVTEEPGTGAVWSLPGWVGPVDLLLLLTPDGGEAGLVSLAQQAYGRGCALAAVAPAGSAVAEAALQARGMPLPFVPGAPGGVVAGPGRDAPAGAGGAEQPLPDAAPDAASAELTALWPLLVPALGLAERVGVLALAEDAFSAAADVLDETAVRCRPDLPVFENPAKALALQVDGTVPLLWSEGPVADAAARRFAAAFAARAGRPALPAMLPEALTEHAGLLSGSLGMATSADPDDFFRDRVEEPDPLRVRVLMLRPMPDVPPAPEVEPEEDGPAPGAESPERGFGSGFGSGFGAGSGSGFGSGGGSGYDPRFGPELRPGGPLSAQPALRARRFAEDRQGSVDELVATRADPLCALAELIATADFAAVYAHLAASGRGD